MSLISQEQAEIAAALAKIKAAYEVYIDHLLVNRPTTFYVDAFLSY